MLQRMHDGIQSWVTWVIIILLVAALSFWGISSYFQGQGNAQEDAAKVNGQLISQQTLNSAYNQFRQQLQSQQALNLTVMAQLKNEVLQSLISKQLLADAATSNHFNISQQQMDAVIAQIPAFQEEGKFSEARFMGILNQMSLTPDAFMQDIRTSMLLNQLQSGIAGSAFILPGEIATGLGLLNQHRSIHYAIISSNNFANKINVPADAIQQYYQENLKDFQIPEQVKLAYIKISTQAIVNKIKPTDRQLQAFYQNNSNEYTEPARWHVAHILIRGTNADAQAKADKIAQQAQQGTNFAKLTSQYSDDSLTADKGGEMPWLVAGDGNNVFETAVSQLRMNQISQPFKTQYGFEIVKLLNVKPQTPKPFAEVQDQVRKAYVNQQAQKTIAGLNEQLTNATFENPNSLDNASKQLNIPIQTTNWITQQGNKTDITRDPQVLQTAFSTEVLAGNNSDVITLDNGDLIVLRVVAHQPAEAKPLASVQNDIKNILIQQQKHQLTSASGQAVIQALQQGKSMQAIAAEYKLHWFTNTTLSRNSQSLDSSIVHAAFDLPRPDKQPSVGGVVLDNGDYAVVILTQINEITLPKIPASERQAFAMQMQRGTGVFLLTELEKYYRSQASIKIYPTANNNPAN